MATAVDIFVKDDTQLHSVIAGAVVNVYDGAQLVAAATTNAEGRAALLLDAGTFEVRLFKRGCIFPNPRRIEVLDPLPAGSSNAFDILGTLLTLPVAVDPRVCRCTGRLVGLSNQPLANVLLRFSAQVEAGTQTPKLVDGNLVSQEALEIRTGSDGFASVDLLRGGEFYVVFAGEDDQVWNIKVPDRSSANLVDLLFPRPIKVAWGTEAAPGNVVHVRVGQVVAVPFSILFSDYEEHSDLPLPLVRFELSTDGLVGVAQAGAALELSGISPGTATIKGVADATKLPNRVPTPGDLPDILTVVIDA